MENALPAPSLLIRSRKFGFRMIEHKDSLRLIPLRWSAYTWILLVVTICFLFFVYKGLHVDVRWLKVAVVGPCTLLAAASMFGILTRFYDGVVITTGCITYRYGLVRRSLPRDQEWEVQLRQTIDRWINDGTEQVRVTVELWLIHRAKAHHLFDYHGDKEEDAAPMQELGERLKAILQNRIG